MGVKAHQGDNVPRVSRATRGAEGFRTQPQKRFKLAVKARVQDGFSLARGDNIGNGQQGYLGPVIGDKLPYLTTTSRADFLSAFNKRVNFYNPERIDRSIRGSCRKLVHKLLPRTMDGFDTDVESFNEWVNQFDSEKQARMKKEYENAGLDKLADYSRKEVFTKIEALVKEHDQVAPRVIFKGTDYYNMISGPVFKILMERFKTLEDRLPDLKFLIAYKQHTPEIAAFMEVGRSKSFMEADFSGNDKTQVKDVLELECMFMKRLGCPRWFLDLHRKTNKFTAYNTKYGVSAIAENQLPTGATDTTFRNSFWNLCIFFSWAERFEVNGARVALLGDDMICGLPRRIRRCAYHYEQTSRLARMVAKVTTSPLLQRMHFLSKHFVPVTRGEQVHVLLPFIGKVLAKFNCRPNSNQSVTDDEYMAGKALSHCYEFRFCHVLRDLFVERANYHLARSSGSYSLEGMTYHVRQFSVHKGLIESMIDGSTEHADLVTAEDLSMFWLTLADLSFSDVFPLAAAVITTHGFSVADNYALSHLVDY